MSQSADSATPLPVQTQVQEEDSKDVLDGGDDAVQVLDPLSELTSGNDFAEASVEEEELERLWAVGRYPKGMEEKCIRIRHVHAMKVLEWDYSQHPLRKALKDCSRKFFVRTNNDGSKELRLLAAPHRKVLLSIREFKKEVKHIHEACGHGGYGKVITSFNNNFYFPCVVGDIKAIVKRCALCVSKHLKNPEPPVPGWDRKSFQCDELWVMDWSTWNQWHFLLVADHYSRLLRGNIYITQSAKLVVLFLTEVMSTDGVRVPTTWHFDNGKEFLARATRALAKMHDIQCVPGPVYFPQRQGAVESMNKYVKRDLDNLVLTTDDADTVKKKFAEIIQQRNRKPRRFFSGLAPVEVYTGKPLRQERLNFASEAQERERIMRQAERAHDVYAEVLQKRFQDKRPPKDVPVGRRVLVINPRRRRGKTAPKCLGLGVVEDRIEDKYRVKWIAHGARISIKPGVTSPTLWPSGYVASFPVCHLHPPLFP